jgi:hypothetical protein
MTELTPRRAKDTVKYAGMSILVMCILDRRAGVAVDVDHGLQCSFYPGSGPGERLTGTAPIFEQARADFEASWRQLSAKRTPEDCAACREHRDFTA